MISLFPLALGQLLDCQLDIATQLPGKPHYFKLFRLLGRVGAVLFRRDLGGIDRRLCSAETYPHFLVLAGRAVGHVDGENLGTFLVGQAQQGLDFIELVDILPLVQQNLAVAVVDDGSLDDG